MPAGSFTKIVASLLLALYLMAPGSVIVHILEETASCGHAEEPIHLELPAPLKGQMQSGTVPCSICDYGDAAVPLVSRTIHHLVSKPSYLRAGIRFIPDRIPDPPFIPPELHV